MPVRMRSGDRNDLAQGCRTFLVWDWETSRHVMVRAPFYAAGKQVKHFPVSETAFAMAEEINSAAAGGRQGPCTGRCRPPHDEGNRSGHAE